LSNARHGAERDAIASVWRLKKHAGRLLQSDRRVRVYTRLPKARTDSGETKR